MLVSLLAVGALLAAPAATPVPSPPTSDQQTNLAGLRVFATVTSEPDPRAPRSSAGFVIRRPGDCSRLTRDLHLTCRDGAWILEPVLLDEHGRPVDHHVTATTGGVRIVPDRHRNAPMVLTALARRPSTPSLADDVEASVRQGPAPHPTERPTRTPETTSATTTVGTTTTTTRRADTSARTSTRRAGSAPALVSVPENYRPCPEVCVPRVLHDYCTWSPDRWGRAPFRGPCARHDLAIEAITDAPVGLKEKRRRRGASDVVFHRHLRTNCDVAYDRGASLTGCNAAAATYLQAVKAATAVWNGR